MKKGQLVEFRNITGFKGVLLEKVKAPSPTHFAEGSQIMLDLGPLWKVYWFQYPGADEDSCMTQEIYEHSLKAIELL